MLEDMRRHFREIARTKIGVLNVSAGMVRADCSRDPDGPLFSSPTHKPYTIGKHSIYTHTHMHTCKHADTSISSQFTD